MPSTAGVQLVALCHASDMSDKMLAADMILAGYMILVIDMMLAAEDSNTVAAVVDIGHNSVLPAVEHSTAAEAVAEIFLLAVLQVSKENGQIHGN